MTISTVRLLYTSLLELLVVMNWMGSVSLPCFNLRVGHSVWCTECKIIISNISTVKCYILF